MVLEVQDSAEKLDQVEGLRLLGVNDHLLVTLASTSLNMAQRARSHAEKVHRKPVTSRGSVHGRAPR